MSICCAFTICFVFLHHNLIVTFFLCDCNSIALFYFYIYREQKEDNDLKEMMAKKGHVLSSLSFDTWQDMKTT